jgi:uncharacterized protein (TIGR01777 family)
MGKEREKREGCVMTVYETTHSVSAPRSEVWNWHTRPGALRRLTPPWLPVKLVHEASSLRDGFAVMRLPGGLHWHSQHRPSEYREHERFTDELVSSPLRLVTPWRHQHVFSTVDQNSTRITDRVTTRMPEGILHSMFAFRQRQLIDDIAAHARFQAPHNRPLTIAITGSSGLVGTSLRALLTTGGHRVIRLVRDAAVTADERRWDPSDPDPDLLSGVDVLVHLAGAPIAGRFTQKHKQAITSSRVGPTEKLARLVARAEKKPVFVSASAVGFYGPDRGEEILTEKSEPGEGFLAEVVRKWEGATRPAVDAGARVVNVRTGIVQTPDGGTLQLLAPLFRAGGGGRLGSGEQWMPWIELDDLLDIYLRAITDPHLAGPVNAVAPNAERNAAYTATLGRVLRRPTMIPTPDFGPQLVLGREGARELAFAGQRVVPQALAETNHRFRFPTLEPALRHVLGRA